MKTSIRRMGNSKGVLIPKALLAQAGLETEVDMVLEAGQIVLRAPKTASRTGWAAASRQIAAVHDDAPEWRDFPHEADAELTW